jgi:prolyl-tRNA synthetase
MLRGKPEDGQILDYCAALAHALGSAQALGAPLRAFVDTKDARPADKRWDWVRRGAPIVCEIGPRDAANGQVSYLVRTALREGDKIKTHAAAREDFVASAPGMLEAIQRDLFAEAKARLDASIREDMTSFDAVAEYFGNEEDAGFKGWVRAPWSKPTGAALEEVGDRLKALKLTIRNAPLAQKQSLGKCIFTGAPAVQEILIARAY